MIQNSSGLIRFHYLALVTSFGNKKTLILVTQNNTMECLHFFAEITSVHQVAIPISAYRNTEQLSGSSWSSLTLLDKYPGRDWVCEYRGLVIEEGKGEVIHQR